MEDTGTPLALPGVAQIREIRVSYRHTLPYELRPEAASPEAAAAFVEGLTGADAREHLVTVFFDVHWHPIAYQLAGIGTATQALVDPSVIFQPAIVCGATAVLIAHTHPSGVAIASDADKSFTRAIVRAGKLLRLTVADSLVVAGDGRFQSLKRTDPVLWQDDDEGAGPGPGPQIVFMVSKQQPNPRRKRA